MSDTKKLDRLLRELDKTTAEVLRQTFEDLTKENARLKERIDQLEKNVTAFAGQLESWGFDAAAKQIRSEIGGDVEAPNFYKLRAENARLKEERRWIPVSERMPEKPGWYPAWYRHNGEWTLREDTYYFGNGQWQLRHDGDIGCWLYPLPEPPEEVEG